jgi:hypothetical protein
MTDVTVAFDLLTLCWVIGKRWTCREEITMAIPGETKRAYCDLCGCETLWEYTVAHSRTRIEDFFWPEGDERKFWRCCGHNTEDGRIKEEYRNKIGVSKHTHRPANV